MTKARPNAKHLLNVSPVEFDDAKVVVGILEYKDHDDLRTLRETHRRTHFFRRQGPDKVLALPLVFDAEAIGEKHIIRLKQHLPLCAALVGQALFSYVHSLGRRVLQYRPIQFVASGPRDNLLKGLLPSTQTCPHWLSIRPRYTSDVRVFFFDKRKPFVGVAFDVGTIRQIDCPCSELLQDGFPLKDLYVGCKITKGDPRLQPRLQLQGRVEAVRGDLLMLADARPGISAVKSSTVFLEPRKEAFDLCLAHVFKESVDSIRSAIDRESALIRTGPGRLDRVGAVVKYFTDNVELEILPGVRAKLAPLISTESVAFPDVARSSKPVYVFDPVGRRVDKWHDRGLRKHGPYSATTFTKNRPRICVICQSSHKGQVEQVLHKFFHGTDATSRGKSPPFADGFIRKYRLVDVVCEFFQAPDDSPQAYHQAAQQAICRQVDMNQKWELALVQIENRFHDLYAERNPYLVTKKIFLANKIASQEFTIETASLPPVRLAYALNNMSLATYAKLDGIPWLIRSDPTIAHELVVGLGSANIGQGRLASRERVVGITTVFSGDGNYWLSNLTHCVPIERYQIELLESLRRTTTNLQRGMNWQPNDTVRLVFHNAFKTFRNEEVEAVKALIADLGEYHTEFAFVNLVEESPYLLYDMTQQGAFDHDSRALKGLLAPDRGVYLRLSRREVLMVLTGPRDVKRPEDGMPRPVVLRLHPDSTFMDTTYLARQIYSFSCHSWRSFFPSSLPVTIKYSNLIAQKLGQLSSLPRWNPDVMLDRIGRTRWFL